MHVPDIYRAPDAVWTAELIRRHPLALLTSNGAAAPYATNVPIIRKDETLSASAELAGTILIGHMNRANPHWSALAAGTQVLLAFAGPHGYVTPAAYGFEPAAPTWDFTVVHLRGTLTPLVGQDATLAVVQATVREFEARFGAGWDMTPSLPYFEQIVPSVGAFEIEVEEVDAMFKLSQEQNSSIRGQVADRFVTSGIGSHRELAELISALPEGEL